MKPNKQTPRKVELNPQLQNQIKWIQKSPDSNTLTNDQLVNQNKKILHTLKMFLNSLNKQLTNNQFLVLPHQKIIKTDQNNLFDEKCENNKKLISALQNDSLKLQQRKDQISTGLQSKTDQKKFQLEKRITNLKHQIKRMKLDQHEVQKKLISHGDLDHFEGVTAGQKLEEQLRCYSVKYVRLLDKYNKSVQKLAVMSSLQEIPDHIHIPEQIYNQELQKRQEQQFKQYKSIVKLCSILEKRNDAEHNKAHRIYNQKLKELQRLINNLGQVDRTISLREGELLQTRKYLQMMKYKMQGMNIQSKKQINIGYDIPRNKSHSTFKSFKQKTQIKKRGISYARLLPIKNISSRE